MMEWFNGKATFKHETVTPKLRKWMCPMDGCGGEMVFTGEFWPTTTPGYHHKCTACGYAAAMRENKYPFIVYDIEKGGHE